MGSNCIESRSNNNSEERENARKRGDRTQNELKADDTDPGLWSPARKSEKQFLREGRLSDRNNKMAAINSNKSQPKETLDNVLDK